MKKQSKTGRWVTVKLAVLGTALTFAGSAFAHVFPQKQEPGAGATVAAPQAVTITFDGPLEPAFSTLTVTDARGKQVTQNKASIDPRRPTVMSVALPALANGRYTVHWAAVATDGHRTHGDYAFNVK
jgi:methionine-rich copper-binding protein CopC